MEVGRGHFILCLCVLVRDEDSDEGRGIVDLFCVRGLFGG